MDLDVEIARLLDFAARARVDAGFGHLDATGSVPPQAPVELWITCRMTHVFGLASLLGPDRAGARALLDHGVAALLGPWRDERSGGWFTTLRPDGAPDDDSKAGYAHAFVVLAGATATAAGHPRGPELLAEAVAVLRERFWEEEHGMVVDAWDRDFATCDAYRGLNANMHAVEALLAAYDVSGDSWALAAATRIGERVAHDLGPGFSWRLPEHFDEAWVPQPEHHRDRPADPFQPYGVTIGHLLEWSRLLLHLHVASTRDRAHRVAADRQGLLGAAAALTGAAIRDGWAADGTDGFVYTTDFDGAPVVRERMHWVIAEAVANAAMRITVGLDDDAERDLERWLGFAEAHHVDLDGGSWWHELDADLRPSGTVWPGKPDVYHQLQALWLARRATTGERVVSFAGAAAAWA
ncbi:MAG: AGE family epimerase/isomerase [Actinobacteria bacterium]|uniref:Unannotated protein n=1 Tax=freshwater metagenome TaxID=449393 RepID=A0A6J6NRQ3_9ZZZZ|nr:AGE family epimerase/isomerase [Actinomycetota bacterium]